MKQFSIISICKFLMCACALTSLYSCSFFDKGGKDEDPLLIHTNTPARNPYLAAEHYSITHFNSAQTDAFPYSVKTGEVRVDPESCEGGWSGPINLMTLSSVHKDYMWGMSSDRVSYFRISDHSFTKLGEAPLPIGTLRTKEELLQMTAPYNSVEELEQVVCSILGSEPKTAIVGGNYVLCDKDNYAYSNAGTIVARYKLKNEARPEEGIELDSQIDIKDEVPSANVLVGVVMTYDGYLAVAFQGGIAIVDRALTSVQDKYLLPADQILTNSISVDENNGIYLASGNVLPNEKGLMQKIVWKNGRLSADASDGAWKSEYDGGPEAPCIKMGHGSGSTPTLMGFGDDQDKLVVITDGAKRMKVVAFWRDEIPSDTKILEDGNSRIAGQMETDCGLPSGTEWIQSEQSVAVAGYGAFVVNNIVTEHPLSDKVIGVLALGPIVSPPMGVERIQWDSKSNTWKTIWARSDVSSISMIPAISTASEMVFINGYTKADGWDVTGLDWRTGATLHRILFGNNNRGNGAYAILQYFENGDLLFNSVSGPFRVAL